MINLKGAHFYNAQPGVQPQYPVEIDWSHPLTRGLVYAAFPSGGLFVSRKQTKPPSDQNAVVSGYYATFNGTSNYITSGVDGPKFTSPRCSFVKFRGTSTGRIGTISWGADANSPGTIWLTNIENGIPYLRVFNGFTSFASSGLNDGRWHTYAIQAPESATLGDTSAFVDGLSVGLGTGTRAINTSQTVTISLGVENRTDIPTVYSSGDIEVAIVFDRTLSAEEHASLSRDPYQIFRPAIPMPVFTSAGVSYATSKSWNGSAWVAGVLKQWNGSTYDTHNIPKTAVKKTWNGSAWV